MPYEIRTPPRFLKCRPRGHPAAGRFVYRCITGLLSFFLFRRRRKAFRFDRHQADDGDQSLDRPEASDTDPRAPVSRFANHQARAWGSQHSKMARMPSGRFRLLQPDSRMSRACRAVSEPAISPAPSRHPRPVGRSTEKLRKRLLDQGRPVSSPCATGQSLLSARASFGFLLSPRHMRPAFMNCILHVAAQVNLRTNLRNQTCIQSFSWHQSF